MPALGIYFGSGWMSCKPVTGNTAANPSPMIVGVLQDCSVEISREIKELYGMFQAPVAIAPAKHKFTGKAKLAQIFGKQWCDLNWGQTTAVSYNSGVLNEAHTIPATPYQITIAPPGSGTFKQDCGVLYTSGSAQQNSAPLTRVASGPTTGQYSVNEGTGVYTFAAADTTLNVGISYLYNVSTGGFSMTWANQLMGFGPIFEVDLVVPYNSQAVVLRLFNAVTSKTTIPTKNDDFVIEDFEFAAFANASGNVFEFDSSTT